MVDPLLDVRARREHGNQGYLDIRQAVLERVESGIGEPGDNGVAAAIADFRAAWHDLANNPGSDAARAQVLGRAATLADAIRIQSRNIDTESGDLRVRVLADVAEVNTVAVRPGRDQPEHRDRQPERHRRRRAARQARPARDAALRAHRRHHVPSAPTAASTSASTASRW